MAYVIEGKKEKELKCVPHTKVLVSGIKVTLDIVKEEDYEECRRLLNTEIERGNTYPQEHQLDFEGFKNYFLSHYAFSVKCEETFAEIARGQILGCFYVKPNFPGRSSHICNGGHLFYFFSLPY